VTFAAGHGLSDGKRVAIAGVTGNTAANGIWSLQFTAANTARLLGSAGNGTYGGTPRVGVVNDATPLMRGHSAAFRLTGNHVGVVDVEAYDSYADFAVATGANTNATAAPFALGTGVTNSAGSASTPAKSTITTAATNPSFTAELMLPFILRMVPTTATSGTCSAVIEA
jgi:hypothetical protein